MKVFLYSLINRSVQFEIPETDHFNPHSPYRFKQGKQLRGNIRKGLFNFNDYL